MARVGRAATEVALLLVVADRCHCSCCVGCVGCCCCRYSDVLPYDDNRVLLGRPFQQQQAQAAASGGGGASAAGASASGGRRGNSIDSGMSSGEDSYINASLLQGGGSDGDADVAWTYIAAQVGGGLQAGSQACSVYES